MAGSQELHLFYKNQGETPLEAIFRYKKENPEYKDTDFTYAGRLDPMAEGLLILLSGENLKNKEKFLNMDKTYEVEVLWGFKTDTGDLLGKVLSTDFENIVEEVNVKNYINASFGEILQSYPLYSSKPVNGVPLFELARSGKTDGIEVPKHIVKILSSTYTERRIIDSQDLLNEIQKKINRVNGDFRQKDILEDWNKCLENEQREFILDKFTIVSSSGFYVRQFVLDMAEGFKTLGTTFSIKRVKIGDYGIAEI